MEKQTVLIKKTVGDFHREGDLNTKRIKAYKVITKEYNAPVSVIRDVFSLENKAKFFALYWRQKVMRCKTFNATTGNGLSGLMNVDVNSETIKENWFLELKPLSSISDEDALQVSKIVNKIFPKASSIEDGKKFIEKYITGAVLALNLKRINTLSHVEHYLRSRGYALPFMGTSVEDQIEYGWVKLKGEAK